MAVLRVCGLVTLWVGATEALVTARSGAPRRGGRRGRELRATPDLSELGAAITSLEAAGAAWISATVGAVEPALETVHFATVVGVATACAMVAGGARLGALYERQGVLGGDEPVYSTTGRYDPVDAAQYFSRRPLRSLGRGAAIATPVAVFGLSLLADRAALGGADAAQKAQRRRERAESLVGVLTTLGPTFVKVGQALSMRTDLLPLEYCEALTTLQDAVPPFDDAEAKALITRSLGVARLEDLFSEFGSKPIASASLGQVYRATLKKKKMIKEEGDRSEAGLDVAVKVQRPAVTETIALDLHLLRVVAPVAQRLGGLQTDLAGVVDTWGERFVDELDYLREAANAANFTEAIAQTPLSGAVFAPEVIRDASSKSVLTTRWVTGNRLDRESQEDVTALCSVAMNTYLTMMLETGILHADPHPGNLLVEAETRRLAILDWGLVTELDPSLRLAYIEHIAHLVSKDYAKVPADLVALGFVPEGLEEAIESTDAVAVLTDVYSQFGGGGGAAKIDVAAVLAELKGLSDRQGNVFRLPPYFAYIARAFSVLEGIGLTNDPDYAIVQECLPYVSQRLLSDSNPRVADALQTFVYKKPHGTRPRAIDTTRLEYLTDGFGSYTAAAGAGGKKKRHATRRNASSSSDGAVALAEKIADLLLADSMNAATPLQDIVETEIARLVGAQARITAARLRDTPAARAAARVVDPFGLFEALAMGPLVQPDRSDTVSLATASRIRGKAAPEVAQAIAQFEALPAETRLETLRALSNILWKNRAGATKSARRVALKVADQTASRLSPK